MRRNVIEKGETGGKVREGRVKVKEENGQWMRMENKREVKTANERNKIEVGNVALKSRRRKWIVWSLSWGHGMRPCESLASFGLRL